MGSFIDFTLLSWSLKSKQKVLSDFPWIWIEKTWLTAFLMSLWTMTHLRDFNAPPMHVGYEQQPWDLIVVNGKIVSNKKCLKPSSVARTSWRMNHQIYFSFQLIGLLLQVHFCHLYPRLKVYWLSLYFRSF